MDYNKDYTIDYTDVGEDLKAGLVCLASKAQETSLLHSEYAGFSMKWFWEHKMGFVLTGWHFQVEKYPAWEEKINISTRPTRMKGLVALRSFHGTNMAGETLFKADTQWALMDFEQGRPTRILPEMLENYKPHGEPHFTEKISIPSTEDYDFVSNKEQIAARSDIDSNRHVNNISYILWALNEIPDSAHEKKEIRHAYIKYHRETKLHDKILIETYNKGDEYISIIKDFHTGQLKCDIHSIWQDKR